MKKVIVIGCPGAGKTTFSNRLAKLTGLPLYYLDAIWHKPDRTHISREEFDEKLARILSSESYLIDGNYSRTVALRIQNADTVFLFDLPTQDCLQGAIDRLGKPRPEIPWTDTVLDEQFQKEIEAFPTECLPTVYRLLSQYGEGKDIIIFKSRKQADDYLCSLQ